MIRLLWHEIRVRRGALLGWTIGLSFFSVFYMILYTVLPDEVRNINPLAVSLFKSLGVQTLATFEGFILGTEFNVLPLIAGIFGVFMGTGTLAGAWTPGTCGR